MVPTGEPSISLMPAALLLPTTAMEPVLKTNLQSTSPPQAKLEPRTTPPLPSTRTTLRRPTPTLLAPPLSGLVLVVSPQRLHSNQMEPQTLPTILFPLLLATSVLTLPSRLLSSISTLGPSTPSTVRDTISRCMSSISPRRPRQITSLVFSV